MRRVTGTLVREGVRAVALRLAVGAFVIAALVLPCASADFEVRVSTTTLRSLAVETTGQVAPAQAAPLRAAVDADGSGAVSVEELSVFTSVIDDLIGRPNATDTDAYSATWARENVSGGPAFTVVGRSNLSNMALLQAGGLRSSAAWDGVAGNLDRVQTTFDGLAGPIHANVSVRLLMEVTYAFPALDKNEPVHRLTVAMPAGIWVNLTVGGSLEIVQGDNLDNPAIDASHARIEGRTTSAPAQFVVKERAVSNEAQWIVALAVIVPAALIAGVCVYWLPRLKVDDAPQIVEPKYK